MRPNAGEVAHNTTVGCPFVVLLTICCSGVGLSVASTREVPRPCYHYIVVCRAKQPNTISNENKARTMCCGFATSH